MPIPAEHLGFWNVARAATPGLAEERFYEAFFFGDGERLADLLAALVLDGRKRATAGLLWAFEAEGKRPPRPGDLSIMTNWARQPLALIETMSVEVLPFEEVGAEFAATEGEGDATLASWRTDHREFFGRECERLGRTPSERMPVVCEVFRVVHAERAAPAEAAG